MIYFDAAATTMEKPPQVKQTLCRAMEVCASPGRGGYAAAMHADEMLFSCRRAAATLFEADPAQVVFTMNATHGLNIALHSLVQPGARVIISAYEHNAVLRPLTALHAQIQVIGTGVFDQDAFLSQLEAALQQPCSAVVCTHVSNVFGYELPITEIAALCRQYRIPFVLDASQSAGCLPVSLKKTGATFIAMPGHKRLC